MLHVKAVHNTLSAVALSTGHLVTAAYILTSFLSYTITPCPILVAEFRHFFFWIMHKY